MLEMICAVINPGMEPVIISGRPVNDQIIEHSEYLPSGRSFREALEDLKNEVERERKA
jgi:hypothetical protein